MDNARKRELAQAYKERKRRRGVFVVRCAPTGQSWVSATPNLDTQQNAVWFMLKNGGSHSNRALYASWKEHGAEAFSYEVLAELPDEGQSDYAVRADLKALEQEWQAKLSAEGVTG
jgi:hypothetical protein